MIPNNTLEQYILKRIKHHEEEMEYIRTHSKEYTSEDYHNLFLIHKHIANELTMCLTAYDNTYKEKMQVVK